MAWNDLIVRVGMDSKGFTDGTLAVKRDTRGLQDGMLSLSRTLTDQQNKLRELGKAGKGASAEYKNLKADIAANRSQFSALNRELRTVQATQKDVSTSTSKMGDSFAMSGKNLIGLGMAAGAAALSTIAYQAVNVQMEFEKLGVVLANALGSKSEAQKSLRDIQEFAAKTPFQVQELSESFLRLANRGMKPTMEQMRQMGDLAASQGKSFIQLTEAILDAATGEFERLKEFGIKGRKEGDKVTLMFKNQTVEVKNTQEAIAEAIRAMGDYEGVAGGMAAISGTLSGKLSNLKDSWSLLLNELQGVTGASTSVIDALSSMVEGVRAWMKENEAAIQQTIALFAGLGSAAMQMGKNLSRIWDSSEKGGSVMAAFEKSFVGSLGRMQKSAQETKLALMDMSKIVPVAKYSRSGKLLKPETAPDKDTALGETEKKQTSTIKTAASEYQELQKELIKTKEYLDFVGQSTDYVGDATSMIQGKMESIFKMGGAEAVKYAQLLKDQMRGLVDSSRTGDHVTEKVPTLNLLGGVQSETTTLPFNSQPVYEMLEAVNQLTIAKKEMTDADYLALEIQNIQIDSLYRLGDAMSETMEAIGAGAMSASDGMKAFGKAALLAGLEAAKGSIIAASAEYLKTTAKLGPVGLAIAAGLIGGAFGLLKGAVSSSKGLKLAKGGLAYGETQATIGDNPGARFDPEVVAPLSKLEGMLDVGGTQNLTGTFRIHGDDLVLAYDNAQRKTKAFRV